jgi:hypothetical protein
MPFLEILESLIVRIALQNLVGCSNSGSAIKEFLDAQTTVSANECLIFQLDTSGTTRLVRSDSVRRCHNISVHVRRNRQLSRLTRIQKRMNSKKRLKIKGSI